MQRDQDARDIAALTAFESEFASWQRRLREFVAIARRLAAARYPGASHLMEPVVDRHLVDQLRELRQLLAEFEDPTWWQALDKVASLPEVQDRLRERGHKKFRDLLDGLPEPARAEFDSFLEEATPDQDLPDTVVTVYATLTGCSARIVERALLGPNAGAPTWWFHLTS